MVCQMQFPVGANDAELEERMIQHLAAAAAMGRRHFARREGQRNRSSAQGRLLKVVCSRLSAILSILKSKQRISCWFNFFFSNSERRWTCFCNHRRERHHLAQHLNLLHNQSHRYLLRPWLIHLLLQLLDLVLPINMEIPWKIGAATVRLSLCFF